MFPGSLKIIGLIPRFPKSDFQNFHVPCSPKSVSFPCSFKIFATVSSLFYENKWTGSPRPPGKPLSPHFQSLYGRMDLSVVFANKMRFLNYFYQQRAYSKNKHYHKLAQPGRAVQGNCEVNNKLYNILVGSWYPAIGFQ